MIKTRIVQKYILFKVKFNNKNFKEVIPKNMCES